MGRAGSGQEKWTHVQLYATVNFCFHHKHLRSLQSPNQLTYYVTYFLIICVWNSDLLLDCDYRTFEL